MNSQAMDTLPIPVMEYKTIYDDQGEISDFEFLWANVAATKKMSPNGETMTGKRLLTLFPYVEYTAFYDYFKKTIRDHEGHCFHHEASPESPFAGSYIQFITQPTDQGCLVIMQDVTSVIIERDQARGKLQMMVAACDDAVHGIAIADKDHKIVYANPALCQMLGYRQEEMLEHYIGDLMHASEDKERYNLAEKLISEEISQYVTDRKYLTKNGQDILVSVSVSTMRDANNQILSLAHFRDVREERDAQAKLQKALDKAEAATQMKSEFLANMSHEIRTPLNGVMGIAQVLSCTDLDGRQAEHVALIKDSGANLMSLLNDILDLSKVEAGKIDITPIDIDLRHKLSRVFKTYEALAREKSIDLQIIIAPHLPTSLRLDPVRLRQCLSNLLSNAIKFTEKGKVTVAITGAPKGACYELIMHVSDTGIGISSDKLDHIFDSFQQADGSTTRNFGGSGLGLTITRRLARLMAGDLSVVSKPGRGSIFTLRLMANTCQEKRMLKEPSKEPIPPKGFCGRRLLIVDDNLINRRVARSLLDVYGFDLHEAVDGLDALDKLAGSQFDLVLMDMHMPRLDGMGATKSLRESDGINKHIPVIALTANAMQGDRERYLAQGAQGYVSKPINERDLIREIGKVLTLSACSVALAS